MAERDWTPEAREDLARRHRAGTTLNLRDEPEPATEEPEANGNGRTGLLVRLTLKQVSIVLGVVVTLAGGAVAVWTREPSKTEAAVPPRAEAVLSVEAFEKALDASPKYQLDRRQVQDLAKAVEGMVPQLKYLYDTELKRQGREEERQRQQQRRRDEGGAK